MQARHVALGLALCLSLLSRSAAQPTAPALGRGLDSAAVDPAVPMCRNFYRHACGGFIARTPVDERTPYVSLADRRFEANLQQTLGGIFQPQQTANADVRRLAAFNQACMASTAGDDTADLALVQQWMQRIDDIETRQDLAPLMRELAAIGVDPFITYGGRADLQNVGRYRGELHSTRLWADREAIERAFVAVGAPAGEAQAVSEMVRRLNRTATPRYDFGRSQNVMTAGEAAALAPAFDWSGYFAAVGVTAGQTINVTSPAYLRAMNSELETADVSVLKAYLRWAFLISLRGELPRRFDAVFSGAPAPARPSLEPIQRCRDATVRALGVEFSRELSRRALTPKNRRSAQTLAESIRAAAVKFVDATPWLSPSGRRATAGKLAATDLKIGYPDRWPAIGAFEVKPGAYLEAVLAARRFEQAREWRRAHEPRSRRDWEFKVEPWVGEGMAAARLALPNGYPDAFTNSLLVTAAYLLPPRFDVQAPLEVLYGTFGAMFGHELVHVAQTYEFDAEGRLADLWSAVDIASAGKANQCLLDEASAYGAAEGLRVDPARQVHENMADFGGVRLAYAALAERLGPKISRADAAGMTPAKRFFYAYAQSYCVAETDAYRRNSAATDGHGPAEFRVNAALANLPAFAEAFGCEGRSPMARPAGKQCRVW